MGPLRSALWLLYPGRRTVDATGAAQACHWFVLLGLLTGLVYTGVYRAVWRQFGEVRSLPLMPAAVVWLLDVVLLGAPFYLGAARTFPRLIHPSAGGEGLPGDRSVLVLWEVFALVVLVVLKLVLLVAIPQGIAGWPGPGDWRSDFNWMYARPHYRPLILAPLWGRWAMLLVGLIGGVRAQGDGALARFCGSLSAARVLLWALPVTVLTTVYCGRLGRWMFGGIIACFVLAGTYLYAVLVARRQGGQTHDSLLGAALVGELTFLVFYEAFAANIYAS